MIKKICALGLVAVLLAACGGHGGGGSTSTTATSTSSTSSGTSTSSTSSGSSSTGGSSSSSTGLSNFTTLVVDGGPASLTTGANATLQPNFAYVTVTVCAPGTSNCQTIDHVQVDTGSVGLRLVASVLNSTLLAALPSETSPSGNPVGECFQYIDGYSYGSVRQADFTIGGEAVANMPLQVVGDSGRFANAPSSCSSGGGSSLKTVADLGANGIIGIGTTATDCGASCTTPGGYAAAIYYDCPSTGCSAVISRAASTTAPFQQLPNPVAAMSVDNNGSIISFPAVPAGGQASVTGTLYFGIGTQTNNSLGSATVLTSTSSTDPNGAGLITATYKGQILPDSFIDSGSSLYVFTDSSIPLCTAKDDTGFYCPTSSQTLSVSLQGLNGIPVDASFALNNAQTLFQNNNAALPGLGGDAKSLGFQDSYPSSFDFGLPFFYGRNVYTAIEGRTAGSATGPFYAY